jgi:hypothetical protein
VPAPAMLGQNQELLSVSVKTETHSECDAARMSEAEVRDGGSPRTTLVRMLGQSKTFGEKQKMA